MSKAHDLIKRMSEDIDLKVQLEKVPEEYTLGRGRSDRSRLKDLQVAIQQALREAGFVAETSEGLENPLIRDCRRYFCLSLLYQSRFTSRIGALRPQIKIELIHRHARGRTSELPLFYLIDRLTEETPPAICRLACIGVEETLAEKVLSLLRRCAWNWDGHQRGEIDPVLVRHIYDVWCIASRHQDSLRVAASLFPGLVEVDRSEFGVQHPEFLSRPKETLTRALAAARKSGELQSSYDERLVPLVYARNVPGFAAAFKVFAEIATSLLDSLPEDGAT
ncbi:nucleotidyl transferase AbiEii/AbiGii toxin family protein [bacterium]|nr:nucleotidyl transferase AbiEii/AbiGii toxin family protein [bacterium]